MERGPLRLVKVTYTKAPFPRPFKRVKVFNFDLNRPHLSQLSVKSVLSEHCAFMLIITHTIPCAEKYLYQLFLQDISHYLCVKSDTCMHIVHILEHVTGLRVCPNYGHQMVFCI